MAVDWSEEVRIMTEGMEMRKITGALCAFLLIAAVPVSGSEAELPLGMPGLPETRSSETVAPGVTYTRIERGFSSEIDHWTVDVAVVPTRAEAEAIEADLESAGYDALIVELDAAPDDPRPGPSGFVVRSGEFETQAEADVRTQELRARGYAAARSVFTANVGEPTTGPFVVHVLTVDPRALEGNLIPELATGIIPEREKLTDMVSRTGAELGINAGYFVIGEQDGTPGDLAGISVLEGDLVSEAVNGRTSLLVRPNARADVATLDTSLSSTVDGRNMLVDGFNREPGEIRSCGGVGGDVPTELPRHDFTCTDNSELIYFTPAFGSATAPGPGAEVTLDRSGRVLAVRDERGGPIPPNGTALSATGDEAQALLDAADVGDRVRVNATVLENGQEVVLRDRLGAVNGGPLLVERGRDRITAFAEGFVHADNPSFFYGFGISRNPRTIAGITARGELLLVAIDGRQPGYSVGASFDEEAGVMRALGAVDAVNLDGGGSTTLVIDGELVNRPSDATGERPIGDALLLFE
jgi:exopolysaccharide biosynthesis protein